MAELSLPPLLPPRESALFRTNSLPERLPVPDPLTESPPVLPLFRKALRDNSSASASAPGRLLLTGKKRGSGGRGLSTLFHSVSGFHCPAHSTTSVGPLTRPVSCRRPGSATPPSRLLLTAVPDDEELEEVVVIPGHVCGAEQAARLSVSVTAPLPSSL